jgi:fatty acid desaturase
MILAEAITNIHSFCVILPNHAGRDLFRFQNRIKGKAEFYLHQILGTTNYHCGSDVNDFLHGWLNYQIEHHLWPHLSMLQYKKIQPKVKAVCEKYHLPYRQESVFKRIFRMHNIFIGLESMSVGFAVKGTAPSKK